MHVYMHIFCDLEYVCQGLLDHESDAEERADDDHPARGEREGERERENISLLVAE